MSIRTVNVHRPESDDLFKSYAGGVQAVSGVALTLGPDSTGLLGPNGAGKSTLMRILATVTKPRTGTRWNGVDIVKTPFPVRKILGYLARDQQNGIDDDRYHNMVTIGAI